MGSTTIKQYNTLSEKLERMVDGIKIHSGQEGFPSNIKETEVNDLKTRLEKSRQDYDEAENSARIKHDDYESVTKEVISKYANYSSMLYGYLGKKNQLVADFGLQPHRTTGKKGPRTKTKTDK